MPRLIEFKPSSELAHLDIHQLFTKGDSKKKYLLVKRDPWVAHAIRWYWYDNLYVKFINWIDRKTSKKS